jgi:hypothetical protein
MMIGGAAVSGPSAERISEPAQIDFADLHDQASSALQSLRILHERRMAFQQTKESAF